VRVSDYSRECLGLAARTLQEDARAAHALERLPQSTVAFLESRLSWTQVRLLTLVARSSDEARWIETACGTDTRTLEQKVRHRAKQTGAETPELSREPVTKFNVRVSREGRRLWRAVSEIAERSSGSRLSPAQVLELVAAEASSGAPRVHASSDRHAFQTLPELPTCQASSPDAGIDDGAARFDRSRDPELEAFLRSIALDPDGEQEIQARPPACEDVDRDPELTKFLAEIRAEQEAAAAAGMSWREYQERSGSPDSRVPQYADACALVREHLQQIAVREDLPFLVPVERGSSPMERLEALFDLYDSRQPKSLDCQMRSIGLVLQRADADLARLLREALETKLHRARGFQSFECYVDERLDFCSRTAWTLIAIDRATSRIGGEFALAYAEGRLSLLAARVLLRVVGAQHARAWIERAGVVTLRRLEAEVEWALDQRDAASGPEAFDLPAPPPLDADVSLDDQLLSADRLKMRALAESEAASASRPEMRVTVCFNVPLAVAELAEETLLTLRRGSESRGDAFERMLALVLLEWLSAPRHRDPVFERDGFLCAVPACSSRRELHDHHVRFRSLGGDHELDNRTAVCAGHHLRGIHMGRIRATGSAPSILWEFPHMRLIGDRYVARPAAYSRSPAAAAPNSVVSMPTPARRIA
jgi:hypothetical protein